MHYNYDIEIIKLVKKSFKIDDVGVGALVLSESGKIIGKGYNRRNKKNRISCHAEIIALERASKKLKTWNLNRCSVITSLEPCMMCLGAIIQSKIKKITYYLESPKNGFIKSNHVIDISRINIEKINNKTSLVFKNSLKEFFKAKRKIKEKKINGL